ncbi:hypothetical protein CPB83DRAFT_863381 [Crepidotus variabilis]|uniref:Uncharacterized protein n=1 Tax=Crepidotus variabilis TaxID=179855 RepID=A0A9P6JJT7_9AGAR|nr:hypothetical protein CPB83DRAFT_863381 [Crepidotus variabilis]
MEMLPLSPEICKRIVNNASLWKDVRALCRTCKAFQREAEPKIYCQIQLSDPRRFMLACNTLISNERLALHVRIFAFTHQDERSRPPDLGRQFWAQVQQALIATCNLEVLVLSDRSFAHGWILDNQAIQFQLKEAKLFFAWNSALKNFLERQPTLQRLHFVDALEDSISHHLSPGSLPNLELFDGTLMVVPQLLSCPLVYLQVVMDADTETLLSLIPRMACLSKTIRSLNILDIQEDGVLSALAGISRVLPNLTHLGMLPYPMTNRQGFFKSLMSMHLLRSIEVDVSKWVPAPIIPAGQRSLAAEMQIYCPSLQQITIWVGNSRTRWFISSSGQWQHRIESPSYLQFSSIWVNA